MKGADAATETDAPAEHYLRRELFDRIRSDASVFRFIQDGSLDGIWYWDLERPEHEWMSAEFWRLFGYAPEQKQHLASEWQDMIHPEDLKTALENFEAHCADPSHPYDQIVRYRHRDGSTVWVRCRGMAVRDAEGRPIRMLGAHVDITAQMKAYEELRAVTAALGEANAALERSNVDLESLAYVASHDLQEPLRTIQQYTELFAMRYRDQVDERGARYIRYITDGTRRMRALIEDVLTYARLTHSTETAGAVDCGAVVGEVLDALASVIEETSAQVVFSDLPALNVRRMQLIQLFQNLVGNSIKFRGAERPRIEISARRIADGWWSLSVADNGIGIAPAHRTRVFEMFRRLGHDTPGGGTGIGLSIVKRVIDGHGGTIEVVESASGGAEFRFTLPGT